MRCYRRLKEKKGPFGTPETNRAMTKRHIQRDLNP